MNRARAAMADLGLAQIGALLASEFVRLHYLPSTGGSTFSAGLGARSPIFPQGYLTIERASMRIA